MAKTSSPTRASSTGSPPAWPSRQPLGAPPAAPISESDTPFVRSGPLSCCSPLIAGPPLACLPADQPSTVDLTTARRRGPGAAGRLPTRRCESRGPAASLSKPGRRAQWPEGKGGGPRAAEPPAAVWPAPQSTEPAYNAPANRRPGAPQPVARSERDPRRLPPAQRRAPQEEPERGRDEEQRERREPLRVERRHRRERGPLGPPPGPRVPPEQAPGGARHAPPAG